MNVELTERVALITGGSKGIGLAIATRMAECGANLALLARWDHSLNEARDSIAETAKGRIHVVSCGVASAKNIERAYASVIEVYGPVDILVNNARISRIGGFLSITDEVWQADLGLKLFEAIG